MAIKLDDEKAKQTIQIAQKFSEKILNNVQDTAGKAQKAISDSIDDFRVKSMRPVFIDDFKNDDFEMPKLVHVIDHEKRLEDKLWYGAIGYKSNRRGMDVLNIQNESLKTVGLSLFPQVVSHSLYYQKPNFQDYFIELPSYFDEILKDRCDELEDIAYQLGAKSYYVELTEETKSLYSGSVNFGQSVKKNKVSENSKVELQSKQAARIVSSTTFSKSVTPTKPELVWFRNNQQIINLIDARCSGGDHELQSKQIIFECSKMSSMSMDAAIKIDGIIHDMKLKANFSMKGEVEKENRQKMIFNIEF